MNKRLKEISEEIGSLDHRRNELLREQEIIEAENYKLFKSSVDSVFDEGCWEHKEKYFIDLLMKFKNEASETPQGDSFWRKIVVTIDFN